ncbi:MAG: serine/threonine protein kinase [Alphaproteobacteria bacterium]|nr:serine/threonine protein kinase [Alphaproteobacteria bacterium]
MSDRRFHIASCLGKGGFGEVYRARMVRSSGFEVDVALKLLRSDVDPRGQAAQRLRDEARLLGLVRHRAIPRVHDLVVVDGRVALVTEYIDGADLSACLKATPRLSPRAIAQVVGTVADALHAAWTTPVGTGDQAARIVHRDLKPANIRIARDGAPMLLDFGIAWTDAVTRIALTQTSAMVGSPAYMAPERFEGTSPDPANDVFSLGAVLWECLVGRRLFADVSFQELAGLSLFEERFRRAVDARLAELPRDLDEDLHELVGTMLAWRPDQRPDAAEVATALEALAPRLPGPTLRAWCRDHDWTAQPRRDGPWVGRVVTESVSTPVPLVADVAATPIVDAATTYDTDTPPTDALDLPSVVLTTAEAIPVDTIPAPLPDPPPLLPSPRPASTLPWTAGAIGLGVLLAVAGTLWRPPPSDAASAPDAVALPLTAQLDRTAPPTDDDATAAPDAILAQGVTAPSPVTLATDVAPAPVPVAPTVRDAPARPPPTRTPAPATRTAASATPPPAARVRPKPVALPDVDTLLGDDAPTHTPAVVAASVVPTPAPRAAPVASQAAPAAPPEPVGPRVSVDPGSDVARIDLTGPGGTYHLPATVPEGKYTLTYYDAAGAPYMPGSVTIAGDGPMSVICVRKLCSTRASKR